MSSKMSVAFRVGLIAACVMLAVLPAAAQGSRTQLSGTYSFTGEQACLVSPAGFSDNLMPVTAALASVQSASTIGTMTFNADGTGTAMFKELLIIHPPAALIAASEQQASFNFSYTFAPDGELKVVIGTVSGSFIAGPLMGVNFTNNPPPLFGRVAKNGSTILLTTRDPAVETTTLTPPVAPVMPRICHRSRVVIPVHVDGGE